MHRDNISIQMKWVRFKNKNLVNIEIRDYQEKNLNNMKRQFEAAENLELVSVETLIQWRDILLCEQESLRKAVCQEFINKISIMSSHLNKRIQYVVLNPPTRN